MKATGPIYKGTAPPAEESQPMLEKQSQPASDETKAEGVLIRYTNSPEGGDGRVCFSSLAFLYFFFLIIVHSYMFESENH